MYTTELMNGGEWNNLVRSVKVTHGYILRLYDDTDKKGRLLNTLTHDNPVLDPGERASSLSCTFNSKYSNATSLSTNSEMKTPAFFATFR